MPVRVGPGMPPPGAGPAGPPPPGAGAPPPAGPGGPPPGGPDAGGPDAGPSPEQKLDIILALVYKIYQHVCAPDEGAEGADPDADQDQDAGGPPMPQGPQ